MSARRLALSVLGRIERGGIEFVEGGERVVVGEGSGAPRATVHVHSPRAWGSLLRGSAGMAESYADGLWDCDDLVALIRVGALNMDGLDRLRERFAFALRPAQRLAGLVPRNTRAGSRRNISAHYDLGNRLFELFLDDSLTYSCALFESPDASLEEAQRAKLDRICRALELRRGDDVLEIGTGWGSLALHAAGRHRAAVTTTTVSREQFQHASARAEGAGLGDRVTILNEDYRDLRGRYDKLVSVEMVEAVGWQYFDEYFARCSDLLAPDGLMLLQAIVIDDRAYEAEKASPSFINTHIFPGGCLPSVEVIQRCVARSTDMDAVWMDDITPHYAETLRRWRARFDAATKQAGQLGYDRRFRRLWDLYLAYCEAGFRERRIRTVQLLLAKPDWRGALAVAGRDAAAVRATPSAAVAEAAA